MGLSRVYSRAVQGMTAPEVIVEVHVSNGLPSFSMVGLPDTEVKESRDRVRSAIQMSGFDFPARRITVNLAPADLPKDSGRYDLPIAIGVLLASGLIKSRLRVEDFEIAGELALDGDLRRVSGALAIAYNAATRRYILPLESSLEANLVGGVEIYPAKSLKEVIAHLTGEKPIEPLPDNEYLYNSIYDDSVNLNEVRGHIAVKEALEIAASGRHSVLLVGNPGCGKSMLAQRIKTILPPLSQVEAVESAAIYSQSITGFDINNFGKIPFRQPHHSCSSAALIGGGGIPKPGEISLAHNGVLFLDEIAEFERRAIETLREPMETKKIHLSRARRQVSYPADFQLVAAMNPCPCGNYGHPQHVCKCTPEQVTKYQGKLSGPFLDRIDLMVPVSYLKAEELDSLSIGEDSSIIRKRVIEARKVQIDRQGKLNYSLTNKDIESYCILATKAKELLLSVVDKQGLSARVYFKILKIARTIADLAKVEIIEVAHIAKAIQYKKLF
jgi:magnesium chelatase family protein